MWRWSILVEYQISFIYTTFFVTSSGVHVMTVYYTMYLLLFIVSACTMDIKSPLLYEYLPIYYYEFLAITYLPIYYKLWY